jgi:hypothetical protein
MKNDFYFQEQQEMNKTKKIFLKQKPKESFEDSFDEQFTVKEKDESFYSDFVSDIKTEFELKS